MKPPPPVLLPSFALVFMSDRIAAVRTVLTNPHRPYHELAREVGYSYSWVRQVLNGDRLTNLMPELPRQQRPRHRTKAEAEALVRATLSFSQDAKEVARAHGCCPGTVNKIAIGALYADLLPELPRRKPMRQPSCRFPDRDATCHDCRLFDHERQQCSLGLPEATTPRAARQCAAFWEAVDP